MSVTQRVLLALLAFSISTSLFAQVTVKVEIKGLEKALEDNVRLLLSIEHQKDHKLMSEPRLRRLHKIAPDEITQALQPFGYYRPVIESKIVKVSGDQSSSQWLVNYNITPGEALHIAELNFTLSDEMSNDPKFQLLVKTIPLQVGGTFSHIAYDKFKNDLAKTASERGYFNARFIDHRVEINLDTYKVHIHLDYDGGARYSFGEVTLNQDVIDTELLKRYIPFEKGTPYSLNQLIELQQVLNDSYYFQTVEVSPGKPLHESKEIPITVKLTPRKRHRLSFGLGYGTDTGARAKFGWEMPRYNSKGHRFNADTQVSQIGYSVTADYRVPVYNPRTDQFIYSAGIINENIDDRESTLRTIGISFKHKREKWRRTFSLNYQQEDFVVADDSGRSVLLIPGMNWSRTWGNNFINVLDGVRFDIDLRGAKKGFISDNDFVQLQSNIKFITPFGKHNRIITRGTAGRIWSDEFQELPTSIRFFTGGAQSVRGYSYNSLGPVDESGDVVGGQYLLVGSIELEHSFKNKWGVAVFYDAGNAIDDI